MEALRGPVSEPAAKAPLGPTFPRAPKPFGPEELSITECESDTSPLNRAPGAHPPAEEAFRGGGKNIFAAARAPKKMRLKTTIFGAHDRTRLRNSTAMGLGEWSMSCT